MRIARLDGIRGLAIVMVLLHHHELLNTGWTGVDLFFVLSGFLITGILLKSKNDDNYWSNFYRKRVFRILPPLIPLLIVGILCSPHISPWAAAGYIFFLGNVVNATGHAAYMLFNVWSLAVEEHFYLLWPIAVLYLTRKRLAIVACAVLLLDPLLRVLFTPHVPAVAIYVLTPFRLDGLAAGSLLALFISHEKTIAILKPTSFWACATAFVIYVGVHWSLGDAFSYPENHRLFNGIGYSLIAAIAFFLIAHVLLNENALLSRIFSFSPLAALGRISYGVYLYHSVVIVAAEKLFGLTSPISKHSLHLLAIFDIPVVIAIAYLSFRFYELPIMQWSSKRAAATALAEAPQQVASS
ncbi:acyltransferase family protein [Tunturiibacter lichenicola]|uniref:acyltransferase family protein n=1 Tax=Tunturiibacter lichenicola TaxID=2051959 RepID=UPI0021B1756D|nr:acyltransferase [Edaphobacter lichenicola]